MRAFVAVLAMILGVPALAAADVSLGLGRALDRPLPRAPQAPEAPTTPAPPTGRSDADWAGPQVQLGYSYYRLSDGWGGGDVHAGGVSLFIQLPLREFRLAAHAELGARDYRLAGDDLVARGTIEAGFQLPQLLDPVIPHASLLVAFGGLIESRFETTVAHGFGGAGVALGAALRIYRNLHLGVEGAYLRLEMDGAAFDVFQFRVTAGL